MKMNKTIVLSIVFQLIFNISTFAQNEEDETLTYMVEYEAPEKLSMLSFNLPIWHLGLAKTNFSIYDLKGSIHYVGAGKINGGVSYKLGVGDKLIPDTDEGIEYARSSYVMSMFKPGKAQEVSAYATFFIKETTGSKEESYSIKKTGRIHYYTMVNTKYHKKHGISVGYSQGFTWYNMNKISLDLHSEQYNVSRTEQLNSMSTVQQYKFITLGYQHIKSVNSKMNFAKYGFRDSRFITVTGANVIYAIQNKFDDVYFGSYDPNAGGGNGTIYFEQFAIAESNKRLNIGVEFYQRYFIKRFPISFEYKVAYLPGLLKNLNVMLNIGVNFQIDALRGNLKKFEKPIDKEKEAFEKIRLKVRGK